jgi:hypothetical protein
MQIAFRLCTSIFGQAAAYTTFFVVIEVGFIALSSLLNATEAAFGSLQGPFANYFLGAPIGIRRAFSPFS